MNFNLAWILVSATGISGFVWLLDKILFAGQRSLKAAEIASNDGTAKRDVELALEPWWVENARSFFPVLLFVLILRSFIVEPFRIPSGSMMSTLMVGDFILVSKSSYGLRLPIGHKKFFDLGEPERGDVAVFRFPRDPSVDYIKRVVGLPGDTISYVDKRLYLNGELVPVTEGEKYTGIDGRNGTMQFTETLGGEDHTILRNQSLNVGFSRDLHDIKVPEGHYFLMGDNRDNSNDSRYWGFVPEENLVGRAFFIWLNVRHRSGLDFDMDWGRIGNKIQ